MFEPQRQQPVLAAGLIVVATMFIASATLIAKLLGTDALGAPLHPFQISQGRFVFAFAAIAMAAATTRLRVRAPHWRLHIGRTMFGWMGVTLMFSSVARIPMADATAISFVNPVFAMLLAIPLLGERVGPVRWAAAAIAMGGALILLRPTPESFQPGALLALAAAGAMGMELIFIKKLTAREAVFQILLVNNLIGVGISTLAVLPVWVMPSPAQWGGLVLLGLVMVGAQGFFVNAMARADASFVAPFSYATLVFAALYDFVGFGAVPDGVTVLGAAIILGGAAMLAWREGRKRAAPHGPALR